jgi:peptide/nickel transport system ATP-binding protein
MMTQPILSVRDLRVVYGNRGIKFSAISDISFDVAEGETLGVVGESGCGKSTTGRAILQLPKPSEGSVIFEGKDITAMPPETLRLTRRRLQMIFQDPVSSLNPRRRVRDIVAEPLVISGEKDKAVIDRKVRAVLAAVGVDAESAMDRRPHQFSGGQCQRICIARALVQEPKLIVCDEPVSALDVSVQAQILNLLEDMKDRYKLTLVFISHDLAVVKNISDRVAVMYLGRMCELAASEAIYATPRHPYTAGLLASIPNPGVQKDARFQPLAGELPSPVLPPKGCRFHTRCPIAKPECAKIVPEFREIEPGHFVACHHPLT